MATKILVPELGESVVEATVGYWMKREGDQVAVGEPVVELETDKVNLEVGAAQSGVLARIERGQGEDVRIGDVLGVIEDGAETAPAPSEAAPEAAGLRSATGQASAPEPPAQVEGADAKATPVAQRLAAEQGIEVASVPGTGAGGRVTRQDVEAYLEKLRATSPPARADAEPPPARGGREERVRMSRRRRTIARRLVEAQHTAAMLTTFNELDMSAVMAIRARRREAFKEQYGVGLGFMSFFVKASIGALKAYPQLNAEIDGDDLVLKRYYDIGIAVGAEEGLVVPVLRDADQMSFADIERAIKRYVEKAQAGTLSVEDLRGGTFTLTNGGVFGSLLSTPILNPPQVGILGLHKIEERPVAQDGQVVIRPMMYVALSYDHRIVDGREAVQFLVRIKQLIEDPEALLLEG